MDSYAISQFEAYLRSGRLEDLNGAIRSAEQIVQETPDTHSSSPGLRNNLGLMLQTRFERLGVIQDLDNAIGLGEWVLDTTSPAHPNYPIYLSTLGNRLMRRYERWNTIADLERAIDLGRTAKDMSYGGHVYRTGALKDLGAKLARRHEVFRDLADLNEAIDLSEEALADETEITSKIELSHNLANMYDSRFSANAREEDLEKALGYATDATSMTPNDDRRYGDLVNGLSALIYKRFIITTNMEDLENAISKSRDAIDATPRDHPYLPGCRINLGHKLWKRYERTGRMEDLAEALQQVELGVAETPNESSNFPVHLNSFAALLQKLYERSGTIEDLEWAIVVERQALEALQSESSQRSMYLNNLSVLLVCKSDLTNDETHLEDAIEKARQSVKQTQAFDRIQASHWNNLGICLEKRFRRRGSLADLEEAIECGKTSTSATPEDHIDLPGRLNNLAHRLCLSAKGSDQEQALECFKRAWNCLSGVPFYRVDAARQIVKLLVERCQLGEANEIAKQALELLPLMNNRSLNRQDQQHVASKFSGLVSQACSLSIQIGDPAEEALILLERGRGSIMGLLIDDRSDTAYLKATHPEQAENYERLRALVNNTTSQTIQPIDAAQDNKVDRLILVQKLEACINQIRNFTGYERFLMGPTPQELMSLANEGPIVFVNVADLRSDAFIISPSAIKHIPLTGMTMAKVKAWLELANGIDMITGQKRYNAFLKELWVVCVKPILQDVCPSKDGKKTRLWWIGVGAASSLPFHAAGIHGKENVENTASLVISSYIPTLKALSYARERARIGKSSTRRPESILVVAMPETVGHAALPGVVREMQSVQLATQNKLSALLLVKPDTKTVLGNIGVCDVVHFACHGISDPVDPLSSYLLLENNDGVTHQKADKMTVRQISEASMSNAKIAYLSACSTAENNADKLLDEVIHLASAFQVAGFSHVIASMWTANDEACITLAEGFYQRIPTPLSDGGNDSAIAASLHHSVEALRLETPKASLRWGSFIHIGA